MDESRRSFLKQAGCTGVALGCGLPVLSSGCNGSKHGSNDTSQLALVIDVEKCWSDEVRRACADACHREHNVPSISDPEEEVKWIWDEEFEHAFPDQHHEHMADSIAESPVLVLCNQCKKPPCVKVCPTQATWKRERDGIVMMDMHRCIGCRYCMAACPYGARSFNWKDPRPYIQTEIRPEFPTRAKGVVEKCNFCAERLRDGREPACVEAANAVPGGEGALTFGNLSEPDSEVSRVLRQRHTICRRLGAGTGPNVFYAV